MYIIEYFLSDREKLEMEKKLYEDEIRNLTRDEELIGENTSQLAILYKRKCLVDKSKSDAVTIYLNYQISKAKADGRTDDYATLNKELLKNNLLGYQI